MPPILLRKYARSSAFAKPASCDVLWRRTSITLFTPDFSSRSKKPSAVVFVNPMVEIVTPSIRLFRSDRAPRVGLRLCKSHFACTISVGCGQSFFARREHVVSAETGKLQEPILDLVLCCDCAVTLNVSYPNSARSQSTANEKAAMAVQRILLRAHQCNLVFACALDDALQTFLKIFSLCHLFVVGHTFAIELLASVAADEFLTQEYVGYPVQTQSITHFVAIEMRREPRVRRRADVSNRRYSRVSQERDEPLPRMSGVSDGPNS